MFLDDYQNAAAIPNAPPAEHDLPESRALAALHGALPPGGLTLAGTLRAADALTLTLTGLDHFLPLGSRVRLHNSAGGRGEAALQAEIIAARTGALIAAPFGPTTGLRLGARAIVTAPARLAPHLGWCGRVLDALGRPADGQGPLSPGTVAADPRAEAPPAASRERLGPALTTGVRAIDAFATLRQGQRIGLFAGSGIGKSTLLGMLARNAAADVIVIALIGERGRELREFLEDDLGPAGRARAITVAATSDAAPALRREAAATAMAIAEGLRDQGLHVLLLIDSLTRFCAAGREIGLAAGEPPASRGYPPSVFASLPRLLERAGPGALGCAGAITAIATVLVDGGDHDEPVADAARGLLDGHIVLDRAIAEAGRYPAIDVLRSLSRCAGGVLTRERANLATAARAVLARAADMRDLVRLGAYTPGADAQTDAALRLAPRIEAMLQQSRESGFTLDEAFAALATAMETQLPAAPAGPAGGPWGSAAVLA